MATADPQQSASLGIALASLAVSVLALIGTTTLGVLNFVQGHRPKLKVAALHGVVATPGFGADFQSLSVTVTNLRKFPTPVGAPGFRLPDKAKNNLLPTADGFGRAMPTQPLDFMQSRDYIFRMSDLAESLARHGHALPIKVRPWIAGPNGRKYFGRKVTFQEPFQPDQDRRGQM